jgi:hypothetical protein
MNRDEEGACDQPGDPKKAAKRREQNRLAKRRSREKQKQDQVRNEGEAEEEKEPEGGGQLARTWRMLDQQKGILDQQDRIINKLELGIAEREEHIGIGRRSTSVSSQWTRRAL